MASSTIRRPYDTVRSFVNNDIFLLPRHLDAKFLRNCIVLPDRVEMIRLLPKLGKVAEMGTQKGNFAKEIIGICNPQELHLFDMSFRQEKFPFEHAFFEAGIQERRVVLHEGDSSTLLSEFPDAFFDWIYIDGDHSFEGVSKDIAVAKSKIKSDGYLVFNDYAIFSPLELIQYGVQRAVNDLCIDENFEIVYFAFCIRGYHDVCLRRLGNCAAGSSLKTLGI